MGQQDTASATWGELTKRGLNIGKRPVYDPGSPIDALLKGLTRGVSQIPERAREATVYPWRRATTAPAQMSPLGYKSDGSMLEALAQGRAEPMPRAVNALTRQAPTAMADAPSDYGMGGFRSAGENAYDVQAAGEPGRSGGFIARRPGAGDTGAEWTARQTPGNYQGVGEPMAAQFRRPTEELWKQAAMPTFEQTRPALEKGYMLPSAAPGVQQAALSDLFERVGPNPEQQLKMLDAQIPVRQQEVAGQYGLQQEALKGQYGLRGKQLEQDSLRQGYDTLRQFLGASGEGGIRPGSSVSLTGIGSYRAPQEQRVPQGLLRDLLAARTDWEDSAGTFGSRDEVLGSQYRQALGSVFAQDPSHPETQELAKFIATNPELAELPVQELMQDPRLAEAGWSLDEMTDEDWDDLSRLLNYSRGATGF